MKINNQSYRTIWLNKDDGGRVELIDQTVLPHEFKVATLTSYRDGIVAIKDMWVRGAPLIGATAAWSLYLAALEGQESDHGPEFMRQAGQELCAARPTAVNLQWAVDRVLGKLEGNSSWDTRVSTTRAEAEAILEEDVAMCEQIGEHGLSLLKEIKNKKGDAPVKVLTHCNAGWLATVDWGTATAPIYKAKQNQLPIHVWVDETRPRNQGAYLTAYELANEDIPHDIIVDNAGGHLMQQGEVDVVIVGTDRTAANGDVANKIGTYLKALAAFDNGVPFYVAAPSHSIDWSLFSGHDIPIEERDGKEVTHVAGNDGGQRREILIANETSSARNPSFDITPARLVTGLITERGVCEASETGLAGLFPEKFQGS
ncbi:MAG: S-methyl-5-thioribose-1-phosphate isomerase [Pseudomonadota bacterium]